jgi:outer membrane protein assembly factor BamB
MLVNGVVNMQENNIYIVQGEHDYTNYLLAFDATQNVELWRKVSCNSHWDIKIYEDIVLNATSDKQYCFPYPHDISRINAGYALDLNTGEEKWSWNSVLGSPIAGNSTTIYFINSLDIIHAVNPATGKIKWSNDEIIIDSIVHENDNFVYAFEQSTKISDSSHSLYAINAKNGSIKWEFEANNEINSGMVIGDKIMFWTNSVIYFVDMETGEQIWSETPLNSSIANVIFRNNILLVTTHDGHLIAFR